MVKSVKQRFRELKAEERFISFNEQEKRKLSIERQKARESVAPKRIISRFAKKLPHRLKNRVRLVGRTNFTPKRRKFTPRGAFDV